jgi:hypothetical protein
MRNESTAACMARYNTADVEVEGKGWKMILRLNLRAIPWMRVIVDTLLVVGILLASANLLSVR